MIVASLIHFEYRTMFRQIASESLHVLHYLLPVKRDAKFASWLRSTMKYPTDRTRANRFKNCLIQYSLWNFQRHLPTWLRECTGLVFLYCYVRMYVCMYVCMRCIIQPPAAKPNKIMIIKNLHCRPDRCVVAASSALRRWLGHSTIHHALVEACTCPRTSQPIHCQFTTTVPTTRQEIEELR